MGEWPNCDNCHKSQAFCEWPGPGWARCCKRCNGMKLRCAVDGVPQSWKQAQAEELGSARPSKRAWSQLFISELGSDDDEVWVVAETVKVRTQVGNQVSEECCEMVVALRAHNTSIQLQVDAQEWMGHQVEHLVQAMDLQWEAQEVLASALL